jgi:integrase
MNSTKISIQLIDDVSTYTGQVSFRLRYTQNGKVVKNVKLPFIAPEKINKKDIKAVIANPYYKKATEALIQAKNETGIVQPFQSNFIAWAETEANMIKNEKSKQKFLLIFKKVKDFSGREKINFSEINFNFCVNFQNYLLKKSSQNHAAEIFRKYMQYVKRAKVQGLINSDFSGIKRVQVRTNYKVGITLTEDETTRLFNTPCQNESTEIISKLQYYTGGQRISDILGLTWEMIEKKEGSYIIPVLEQQKTGNNVYDIVLSSELIDSIKGERKGKVIKEHFEAHKHYNTIDEWMKAAQIDKHVRSHTFRRTAATHLYRKGVNIVIIAKVLGHCSKAGIPNPMQTMQYIGVQLDDMKPVFSVLQGITQREVRKVA